LKAGDDNDDLEVAGEKFDSKYKGRTLEIYGQVRGITRHKNGRASVTIRAPWASNKAPGLTFRVTEVERLEYGSPVLVRFLCEGFKAIPNYRPGFPCPPFAATASELVQIPDRKAGHPKLWAALMRLENESGPNFPILESELLEGAVLTVRVRPPRSIVKKINWSVPPANQWPAALYAFRFGDDNSKRIVVVDDAGNQIGQYSLTRGFVLSW
jgi:hypothetical protein